MLRPSAFQNNQNGTGVGSSSSDSSSKSILRPSSFQLASSKLQVNKNEAESTSNDSGTASSPSASEENISSTTNNTASEDAAKVNPFSSDKVKNTDVDDEVDDDDTVSKTKTSDRNATTSSSASKGTSGLFSSKTPTTDLFAAATRPNPIRNGSENKNIGFVFGQNIHERTMGASEVSSTENSENTKDEDNEKPGQLFAAAVASSTASSSSSASPSLTSTSTTAQAESSNDKDSDQQAKESSRVEDLTKVAREYEESRAQKRKYDEVQTITGEEGEQNVLDVSSKLFAFIASNWEERGPGSLRLNDKKIDGAWAGSRVVFRLSGNLRVLLNTKVWSGMVVEKSSQKSLRFTAIDSSDGQVKIFLAMCRPDDITSLYTALKKRIDLQKERDAQDPGNSELESGDGDDKVNTADKKSDEKDESNEHHAAGAAAAVPEPSSKKEKKD